MKLTAHIHRLNDNGTVNVSDPATSARLGSREFSGGSDRLTDDGYKDFVRAAVADGRIERPGTYVVIVVGTTGITGVAGPYTIVDGGLRVV